MPTKFPLSRTTQKEVASEAKAIDLQDLFSAFEDCHDRYNECVECRSTQAFYNLQEALENYILDFELAGRNALGARSERFDLFRMLFLEGRSTVECCDLLGLEEEAFSRECNAVKARVGTELRNRGLHPLQRYFDASVRPRPLSPASRERVAA
jgi:hypothetical protein